MTNKDMEEQTEQTGDIKRANDPGGARQGNFINYYQFNPPTQRISHLPADLLARVEGPRVALDVGCNSGDLTVALQTHFTSKDSDQDLHILGVDVDPELIRVARRDHIQDCIERGSVTFECLDLTSSPEDVDRQLRQYMNRVSPHRGCGGKFDVVFCFSVTMWIHLNHGDQGLAQFFATLGRWCTRYLVLEPQPWKCYRTASRRMRKLKLPDFEQLKGLRAQSEDQLQDFMASLCTQNGFRQVAVFGETSNWKRRVILFEKTVQTNK